MATTRAGTEEEVVNLALSHLREEGIASLSDNNKPARAARKWFATARQSALRQKFWNFATGWASPAASTVPSLGPHKTLFPEPADCVMVRLVDGLCDNEWSSETAAADPAGTAAEVRCVAANRDTIVIGYTRDITNPRLWTPDFVIAFSYELARLMAGEFGKSANDIGALNAFEKDEISNASRQSVREQSNQKVTRTTSWITARR